jgi:hypothetical protein
VDGTLIEAWASEKSFERRNDPADQGSGAHGAPSAARYIWVAHQIWTAAILKRASSATPTTRMTITSSSECEPWE